MRSHLSRHSNHHGFTLLEVTLVIGILSIILSFAMVTSLSAISMSSLRSTDNLLVQTLRRAQTLSQQNAREADTGTGQWGVYICEGDNNADCTVSTPASIVLFEGNDFENRVTANEQIFEINPNLTFTGALYHKMIDTQGLGTKKGLVFSRFTGNPVENNFSGAIILQILPNSRMVTVNGNGVVER